MKHKHAELMAEYAKDAMETETPWERWECRYDTMPWSKLGHQPIWDPLFSYRRKPKGCIQIHGETFDDAERKLRATSSAAARSVPEDQIEDVIKWTERYLEKLKKRTLVSSPNNTNHA